MDGERRSGRNELKVELEGKSSREGKCRILKKGPKQQKPYE